MSSKNWTYPLTALSKWVCGEPVLRMRLLSVRKGFEERRKH